MVFRFFVTLVLLFGYANASDLAREQRIASQIEDAILVGEPLRLTADEESFLAIHAEANADKVRGGVILLHGMGANPDWTDVIQPLRSELTEYGWETLSLQMPIAASDAPREEYLRLIPEAEPRITAAVNFMQQRQISNLVLLGHSLGARMGAEFLAQNQNDDIRAFVAIGLSAGTNPSKNGSLRSLQLIKIPILDIYGSQDVDTVLLSARDRSMAARSAGNTGYRQTKIDGANHFFHGLEDILVTRIRAWINRVASSAETLED